MSGSHVAFLTTMLHSSYVLCTASVKHAAIECPKSGYSGSGGVVLARGLAQCTQRYR